MKIRMVRDAAKVDKEKLFTLRIQLSKGIDPLKSDGNALQEMLMDCKRMAMGEL